MGKNWAGMCEFLEAFSTTDTDADCAEVSAADATDDPPATAPSLQVRIPAYLVIQK